MKTNLLTALLLLALIPTAASAERLSLSSLQNQITQLTQMLGDTNAQLAQAREDLSAAQSELAELKNNTVLKLDGIVTLTKDAGGHGTILVDGANLQLVNGTGVTDSGNGLGNLVIGYNVSNAVFVDRLGSHNLVLGDDQSYPGSQEVITESVHSDHSLALTVTGDMNMVIGGDQQTSVASNHDLQIGRSSARTIGGSESVSVGANKTTTIGTNMTETIGASKTTSIGLNSSTVIASDKNENIGGAATISVGDDASLNFGKDLSVIVEKNLSVDAGDQISIKTGKASGLLKKDGTILIKGKDITLEGSGGINVKATGDVVIKGSKILQN